MALNANLIRFLRNRRPRRALLRDIERRERETADLRRYLAMERSSSRELERSIYYLREKIERQEAEIGDLRGYLPHPGTWEN